MNDEQAEKAVDILARSASTVLIRALKDDNRWKRGPKFLVSAADEIELREYMKNWALARKMAD
jgi:hypothetical protein